MTPITYDADKLLMTAKSLTVQALMVHRIMKCWHDFSHSFIKLVSCLENKMLRLTKIVIKIANIFKGEAARVDFRM